MSDSTVEEELPAASRVALDNWVVYGLFGALTLAGVAVSTDVFGTGTIDFGAIFEPRQRADRSGTLSVETESRQPESLELGLQ